MGELFSEAGLQNIVDALQNLITVVCYIADTISIIWNTKLLPP